MHFSLSFATLSLFLASALSAPTTLHPIESFAGETTGRHIITLKQGVEKAGLVTQLKENVTITHDWEIINAFAGHFDDDTLNALRANPDVEIIAEDGIMHTMTTQWGFTAYQFFVSLSCTLEPMRHGVFPD